MPTGPTPCPDAQYFNPPPLTEPFFLYFAYGSCMCPVDLQRTFKESTRDYTLGPATLTGYKLRFTHLSKCRKGGVLDVVRSPGSVVEGVLYQLPWRLSELLDVREELPTQGYRQEMIAVTQGDRTYDNVRTYVVVNKMARELAPTDWYFNVVMRGATTCGLPEDYCWQLFQHMYGLQRQRDAYSYGNSAAA